MGIQRPKFWRVLDGGWFSVTSIPTSIRRKGRQGSVVKISMQNVAPKRHFRRNLENTGLG